MLKLNKRDAIWVHLYIFEAMERLALTRILCVHGERCACGVFACCMCVRIGLPCIAVMCVSPPKFLTSELQPLCNCECWLGAPSPPVGGTRLLSVVLLLLWYFAGMRLLAKLYKPSVSCELKICEADTCFTLPLLTLRLPCALACDRLRPVHLPASYFLSSTSDSGCEGAADCE